MNIHLRAHGHQGASACKNASILPHQRSLAARKTATVQLPPATSYHGEPTSRSARRQYTPCDAYFLPEDLVELLALLREPLSADWRLPWLMLPARRASSEVNSWAVPF